MKKEVRISELEAGPIRHPSLPDSFVERVKAFKAALGDVDGASLEHALDNFKRDANPESELLIWERIASTFALFLTHNPTTDPVVRGEMYSVLLGASMGVKDWSNIRHLTEDQINDLVLNYRALRLH